MKLKKKYTCPQHTSQMKYFRLSAICAKSEMKSINLHSSRVVFLFLFFFIGNTHAFQCDINL